MQMIRVLEVVNMYLREKNLDVDCQNTVIKLMFISLIKW